MDEHEIVWPGPPEGVHLAWTQVLPAVGQTYTGNVANGNSKVHYGNDYHLHQLCSVQNQHSDKHQAGVLYEPDYAGPKRKRVLRDTGETPRTYNPQHTLERDLKKIGKLSLSIRHQKEGKDAQKIAKCISAILNALTTYRDGEACDETQQRELEKLRDTVRWAERVAIKLVPQRKSPASDAKAKTRRLVVRVLNQEISLSTTVIHSQRTLELYDVETSSTLRIEPLHASSGLPVAIFFSQQMSNCFTNVIHPIVTAYNRVSSSAEVFQVVEDDDLESLQRLLACGSSSLWDCDEMGRSLLHYACRGISVRCCAFLVDNGADVDRIELELFTNGGFRITPLHCLLTADKLIDCKPRSGVQESLSCAKILLRSGADPTITPGKSAISPLELSFRPNFVGTSNESTTHFEGLLFQESKAFIDLRTKNEDGRSYWLIACKASWCIKPYILHRLVDEGANVAEVDGFGWNCLFQCVAWATAPDFANEFRALRNLLAVFDDIYATDHQGVDIFSYVNEEKEWAVDITHDCGSYRQDLWYCALKRSGLDARYDIAPCARIARYTPDYTPLHYLALSHLDFWTVDDPEVQLDRLLLEHPMTEEEMQVMKRLEEEVKAMIHGTAKPSSTGSTQVLAFESESESASESETSSGSGTASDSNDM